MKVDVSSHAVDRYLERIVPLGVKVSEAEALAAIAAAFGNAAKLRTRSRNGDEQWKCEDPRMVLIVKRDSRKADVCVVTVLGPNDEPTLFEQDEPDEEELEELRDAAARSRGEVMTYVRLKVFWKHTSGERAEAEKLVARRIANAARGANNSNTGLGVIASVKAAD